MSDAYLIMIAEDVKDLLNAGEFSMSFTAERAYAPSSRLEELKDLKVWVVPKGEQITPVSRTGNNVVYTVDVAVQKQARTVADCDPLMRLTEEIADYLDRRELPSVSGAVWVGTTRRPIFRPEDLYERHLFTAVVTLSYRLVRWAPQT